MLRPPLQELDWSASVVRPPLATESLEASTRQSSAGAAMCVIGVPPHKMPSVWSVAGLLSIQRVVMLRPPLRELDHSVSVVRPPLTLRVLEASTRQSSARRMPSVRSVAGLLSIQRVVMLRPPLQELGCFGECRQASSRSESF